MEMVDYYVNEGSNMQYRDAKDVIEEFGCELSKMQGKCLDVGSGGGNVTKEILLPMLPHDAEVVGADLSQKMVNYARKKYSDNRLSYIVLDIETSELPSDQVGQYNNIMSFYCLHWCKDIRRAFENFYQLLMPNGKCLMMFIGYHCGFEAYLRLKQNPRYQPYLQDARRYVPYFQRKKSKNMRANLRKMLEDVGFQIQHCSKREKTYEYNQLTFKNHVCAINPFINRLPDDMKAEFLDELVSEILSQNVLIPLKSKNSGKKEEYIVLRYYLLIAYVQKPLSNV